MSRFHQLSAGKSGSGAGNAPPMVAFIPKAEPPDNISSTVVRPPSQCENCATVFICEPLRDRGLIDLLVLGSTKASCAEHLRSRAMRIAPNSSRNKPRLNGKIKSNECAWKSQFLFVTPWCKKWRQRDSNFEDRIWKRVVQWLRASTAKAVAAS